MNEFGCFICGVGKSTDLSSKCPECGNPIDVKSELLKTNFGEYSNVEYLARGFYGYALLAENFIGKRFVLKVVSGALYDAHDKDFPAEVRNYLEVGQHPNIAELFNAGQTDAKLYNRDIRLYYLVIEHIPNHITFEELAESDLSDTLSSIDMFIGIAIQICSVLASLQEKNLRHNDLHGRNILIVPRDETDYDHDASVTRIVKVVDFGSAVFRDPSHVKERSDIAWLGVHLQTLLRRMQQDCKPKTRYEQYFLQNANRTFFDVFDDNPQRRPSPDEIVDRMKELRTKAQSSPWEPPSLTSAFGGINALAFLNTSYVPSLYSDKFPWIRDVLSPQEPLLLTGPRGCGKTMILLNEQLRTVLCRRDAEDTNDKRVFRLKESKSLGFFVSCRLVIHIYIATGEQPKWLENSKLSVLFFNTLYFSEILDTLIWAYGDELGIISEQECNDLAGYMESCFEGLITYDTQERYGGLSKLETAKIAIEQVSQGIIRGEITDAEVPDNLSTSSPLRKIAGYLTTKISSFRGKRIIFLLDDFTTGIVPEKTQRVLLPLVFCTVPEYVFWVTAHGMSVPIQDLSDVTYEPNREFVEINFGWEYTRRTRSNEPVCQDYLEDVFRRRFRLANVFTNSSLSQLLGNSNYDRSLAEHIRELASSNNLRSLNYHGFDTITQLCTGDVSYVIDLVGKILARTGEVVPVPAQEQNRQIRAYARQALMRLHDVYEYGQRLYEIANVFGLLSNEKLLGKLVGKEKQRPAKYLKIELNRDRLLSPECEQLLRELVRQGVFINGPGTNSSEGEVTLMLLYRRLFAPAAPTCLSDRDTFSWSAERMEDFLCNPRSFLSEDTGPTFLDRLTETQ